MPERKRATGHRPDCGPSSGKGQRHDTAGVVYQKRRIARLLIPESKDHMEQYIEINKGFAVRVYTI